MATLVRDYVPADAEAIAALFNRHRDVPNPIDGGITAAQLIQELTDRDTHTFLVAVEDDKLIGTFGLFHSDGRRVAGPGELIADMFFVAPAHRGGMLTAELFGAAVERMVHSPYSVLRLTVNPANGPAYTLYRRVGCLAVHRTVPGADGNVQLHNFLPLVLRQVLPVLPKDLLDAVVTQRTTSFIPRALSNDMDQDVTVVDGRRVVAVPFAIGNVEIDTVIDIDNRVVLSAELPGFSYRPEAHLVPPPVVVDADDGAPTVLRTGDLELRADHDGTVEVWRDGHLGPVWATLWPTAGRGRVTGWRAGNPRTVDIAHCENALQLTEVIDDTTVTATITLDESGMTQSFRIQGAEQPVLRAYHLVGLRNGRLRIDDADAPLGDGMGVRDAGQLPAAQTMLEEGSRLHWSTAGDTAVTVHAPGSFGLINGTVAEQRNLHDGSAFRVDIGPAPVAEPVAKPAASVTPEHDDTSRPPQPETVRVVTEAGGVVAWKPFGRNVFRAPYPRTRAFANNPRWSAGLWTGGELDRFDRCYGPGWGVVPAGNDRDSSRRPLRVTEDNDATTARIVVQADADHDDPETVVWLTPDIAPSGVVTCFSPYDDAVDQHDLKQRWQRWATAVCVPLRGNRTLTITGDPTSPAHPELLVRCTDSGVLIGAFARTTDAPATWSLQVSDCTITAWSQLRPPISADPAA